MTTHRQLRTLGLLATLLACSASASAQSGVSVYGRINLTAESQSVAAGTRQVLQDNNSRFGLRGQEDLGGGLMAGFGLESAVNADTGTANATFWNRRSEVNLSSASLGMVRMGRFISEAYNATADFVSNHNHDTGTSADALYAGFNRTNNTLASRTPELVKDLTLEVARTAPEGVAGARSLTDFAANYQVGGLALGLGYNTYGAQGKQVAVRAYYRTGPFGFGGYLQRDEDTFGAGTGERNNVRLSAMYAFGANDLHLNVGSAGDVDRIANSSARQYTVAINHHLSKRTKVYAFVTRIDDNRAALYGGDFRSLALGVRHNF
jgi:predicted porin